MRRYLGQLQIYELGSNFEQGWFLIFNKANLWDYRFIEYPLDYTYTELLVKSADAVNRHLKAKTLPAKLNDPDDCPKCPFASICMPDYTAGGNLQISEDTELEGVLFRLQDLSELKQEVKDLEKQRDAILIKGQDIVCGLFMVLWKKTSKSFKATEARTVEGWQKKIIYNVADK